MPLADIVHDWQMLTEILWVPPLEIPLPRLPSLPPN